MFGPEEPFFSLKGNAEFEEKNQMKEMLNFVGEKDYSFGGRENWSENNNHGLPSTSQTQSVTDFDIAMPLRYTLLDSGFELEDPSIWNMRDKAQISKILNSNLTQDL
ncbi:hypothetical protein TNCT_541661 [Trichonephila clavata]|uniref:Uncharacterized protein n=1 Tax=Trichonephila clavata TaxID=2740835 RepID=A0A8X6EXR2_TRICU|nr:hypothetical protein TNCT_541661 [Trichonephila clavata]